MICHCACSDSKCFLGALGVDSGGELIQDNHRQDRDFHCSLIIFFPTSIVEQSSIGY